MVTKKRPTTSKHRYKPEPKPKPKTKAKPKAKPKAEAPDTLDTIQARIKLKNLTKVELVEVGNLIIKGSVSQLQRMAKAKEASVLAVMTAAICARVIEKGDYHAWNAILDRLIGKVKEELHHSGSIDGNTRVIVTLPSNGREANLDKSELMK